MPTIVTIGDFTTKYNQSFSANGELYFIKPFGYLFSADDTPALECYGFQNVYLGNQGWIINNNAGGIGVAFANSTGVIENSGHIYADIGVGLETTGVTLTNDGVIESFGAGSHHAGVYLGTISQNNNIDNYGYIHGSRAGIEDASHLGGNNISNSKFATIAGDVVGIDIDTLAGKVTHVGNDGTIKGGTAAIMTHNGGLDLANVGTIDGQILLNSNADDYIWNYGVITGDVKLGNGSDTFQADAGKSGKVYGQAGNDILMGSDTSTDTLIGGMVTTISTAMAAETIL